MNTATLWILLMTGAWDTPPVVVEKFVHEVDCTAVAEKINVIQARTDNFAHRRGGIAYCIQAKVVRP